MYGLRVKEGNKIMGSMKSTSTARSGATRTNMRGRNANSMKNNRNQRFMILVALLAVALVGAIGVAVAAFTQDLKINGTAVVKGTSWDIHFENLKNAQINSSLNTAKENTAPQIDNTTTVIQNYDVTLKNDGDSITYTFDVKNDGDIDAKITAIVMNTGASLTCNSMGGSAADQAARNAKTCANLNYTLTYADGTAVQVNDKLAAGASKTMKLKLEYKLQPNQTDSDLPDDDVTVSDLGVTITYGQDS